MIDYDTFQQIRQLYDRDKLNYAQIARATNVHWQTVRKWAERPRYTERATTPLRARTGKLEPFHGIIVRLLATHPYSARQLMTRLRAEGYRGGYSILRDWVRQIRPKPAPAFLTLQFAPGQCAQVDWGCWGTLRVGTTRRVLSFFVMVLCWSRRLYLEFTLGQGQEQWLSCHRNAFTYFSGTTAEIMCDNTKTAVLARRQGEPITFNPAYLDFCRHYGIEIKPCGPYRGNEKGRVEAAVAYVKKNFLAGLELADLTSLNAAAQVWLDSVANVREHGETHRTPQAMFAEEQPKLQPLPTYPYDVAVVRAVPVSNRCRVTVDTNRYSVPAVHASGELMLKLYADRLRLFDRENFVAEHVRCFDRHQDLELADHACALLADRQQARHQQLLLQFLRLSPQAEAYHAQLAERRLNVRHHIQKIVALSEIFGVEATGRALTDAHALGAYAADYIMNLLEQRQRCWPEAGALHLTRQSDLLELELPAPDLSVYDPKQP